MRNVVRNLKKHQFLFEELVKRDFKQKYKRTVLGMGWSVLSPLLTLLVMKLIFQHYFGRTIPHYTTYLFCGNLVFAYFREATSEGMRTLVSNASIFMKINVPKYLFLLSKNVSALINFLLTVAILFIFVIADKISINAKFLMLIFPCICLVLLNIGVGLVLSSLYVFFRDMSYLYKVFIRLLMYMSAIFYQISIVPEKYRMFFYFNPVYCYIEYFRTIILEGRIPSIEYHALCLLYAFLFIVIGGLMYKRLNTKFLYYL